MTDSTKPKYLTVVFAINSDEDFAAMRKQIFDNFKQNEGESWTVSAVSQDHEIRRVELTEQAAEPSFWFALIPLGLAVVILVCLVASVLVFGHVVMNW